MAASLSLGSNGHI